ncbi:MAG: DUF1634 domain-containing protein [Euryarchaeota archaeon]|nr:DUF1634 domain-containing protein [Euryarchaeota archaeon]
MNASRATAMTLRIFLAAGVVTLLIGLLMPESGDSDRILWFGVLLLILAPLTGVFVTAVALMSERDRFWTRIASVLICVILLVVAVSVYI